MSWRISTKHISTYNYESPVIASYNEARMSPLSSETQTVLESSLQTSPSAPVLHYFDYWGTSVHAFDLHETHSTLQITSHALVETTPPRTLDREVSWDQVRQSAVSDAFCELLTPTIFTPESEVLDEITEQFRTIAKPTDAVISVSEFLRDHLTYLPGSTSVNTTAEAAWNQRSGVCQDFAHLSIGILRRLNIPTRYVSGYLYPLEEAEVGDRRSGASHAWVEVWLGGWYPIDPTNGAEVGERHVTVAKGRDYDDVKPFHGIYRGGRLESLEVEVELVRLA